MMKPRLNQMLTTLLMLLAMAVSGCSPQLDSNISTQVAAFFPSIAQQTPTPFQPVPPTPTVTVTPTITPEPVRELRVWLDPSVPPAMRNQIRLPVEHTRLLSSAEGANIHIGATRGDPKTGSTWVYALVAPFPTLIESVDFEEVQRAWRGESGTVFTGPLLMSEATRAAFETRWGPPGIGRVEILPEELLLDTAWSNRPSWALVPFESLEPRWKVLRVSGMSPLDKDLWLEDYPLTIMFGISGPHEALNLLQARLGGEPGPLPPTNRDTTKLTTLVMTGVTALARATAYKMDTLGTTYPARDIVDWLRNADLTHISNEVSFNPHCPLANFFSTTMQFCSRPEYIELLDYIGTDIVELSGNHNNDYGREPFSYSLDLYRQRGWTLFGGGANLQEARTPAKIEHNGNKLAFIACNPVGPEGVFATEDQPGVASCEDYDWILETTLQLRNEGYLPIVTFQYFEIYYEHPSEHQQRNFRAAVDAGAVIVSGSQAHYPQDMEFYNGSFIHYGLGNLFFDQMDIPVPGTRNEFIDQHVFYDGRHINTTLLTAILEDYARPRPMTDEERSAFLEKIFKFAGW